MPGPAFAPPAPFAEPSERWVRVRFGGETVADCRTPTLLVWYGPGRLPTYLFPRHAVRWDLLSDEVVAGGVRRWTVRAGGREAPSAAWSFTEPPEGLGVLRDLVTFDWGAMDAWLEEELELFVHARDPHKRVDAVPSSRHVEVSVEGVVVADSRRPHLLFETTLPTRYYLPREDVRMDLLEPSETVTRCPYKGTASYLSVRVGDRLHRDLAWTYPDPIPENPRIAGLVAFFNEAVDIRLDGERLPRPVTPWSAGGPAGGI